MEEEGESAATELSMCNYGKSSGVQTSTTEKTLIDDFEVMRDEIYIKRKVRTKCGKKTKVQGPQNGF